MYKNPDCGCCDRWAQYLEANGFTVLKINTNDLASIKEKYRIPTNLAGCHTALIEGYVVEGLVPAKYIKRMLSEHLAVRGLSLPGMRSEEHTSELQSLMRISYADVCLKKKTNTRL